jgi:hypothetical protein
MHKSLSWLMILASAWGAGTAHAQTYNLDITMSGIQSTPTTFLGSFTFNAGGSCLGSAAFCPSGSTPDFTNINIHDPLSIDSPGGPFAFTDATSGGGGLKFIDTYAGIPGFSSFIYMLSFNISTPLGGTASSIGLSQISFVSAPNVTGIYSCGGATQSPPKAVTCTTANLTKAPEVDPGAAVSGITILLLALAVLRGRRTMPSRPLFAAG